MSNFESYLGLLTDAKRKVVKVLDDSLRVDGFCCGKPVIIGLPVNDPKAIEPEFLIRRNVIILSLELPSIRHITAGAYIHVRIFRPNPSPCAEVVSG